MSLYNSSQAIVCEHCGAPLAVKSNKISQCDHCNSQNALSPDMTQEILLSKKAKESRQDLLNLLNKNSKRRLTTQDIVCVLSKDISHLEISKFSEYLVSELKAMEEEGILKIFRGRSGGWQTILNG